MMTKKDDRNWLLSTRPCHIWLGFKWEGKDFYLSWHYRGGLQRCPLKSQCSFCALQQPKCFKAIPCCTICTPTPVERKEKKVFKAACSALCWEKERAFYEGQSLQNVCWRAKRYYRSSRSFSMRHSLLPSSVKSALLQHSMCIVFGYYQCIMWEWSFEQTIFKQVIALSIVQNLVYIMLSFKRVCSIFQISWHHSSIIQILFNILVSVQYFLELEWDRLRKTCQRDQEFAIRVNFLVRRLRYAHE